MIPRRNAVPPLPVWVWAVGGGAALASGLTASLPDDPGTAFLEVDAHQIVGAAQDRPFLHREHEGLSCLECHGSGEDHGVVTVRTARDCAACHHNPGRGYTCEACHLEADLPPPADQDATLSLTVWDEPRTRPLPFDHRTHGELSCDACHTGGVLLAVETECAACHADHHRPDAECSTCHTPGEPGAHDLEVHLTCVSAGCHGQEVGDRPALTRSLCLMCHTDQRDHEPGLRCDVCHMIPHEEPAAGAPAQGVRGVW